MVYEARTVAANGLHGAEVKVVDPHTGKVYGIFDYADTDTGLLKGWDVDAQTGKVKTTPFVRTPAGGIKRELMRLEYPGTLDFDIVSRRTGQVVHSFRVPRKTVQVYNRRKGGTRG